MMSYFFLCFGTFFSSYSRSVVYFIFLLIDNPKVSIHPSRIRRRFCDKRNVYWLPWNVLA